ncbi:hypothetical protein BGZ73_002824 [Actinomortierella ambigua]|nr:hypothetical protein BGZ73_002824 [Actinomortierella ambigua]
MANPSSSKSPTTHATTATGTDLSSHSSRAEVMHTSPSSSPSVATDVCQEVKHNPSHDPMKPVLSRDSTLTAVVSSNSTASPQSESPSPDTTKGSTLHKHGYIHYDRHDTDDTLARNATGDELDEDRYEYDEDDESGDDAPPEGGTRAWLVILGTFLVQTFVFAQTEYIFGVFAENYLRAFPGSSASQITLVGTIGSGVTYLAGVITGILSDRIGYRITSLTGTLVMTCALIFASFATEVWHLYLSQGVLFGIGASMSYYPAMGAPSHWFEKRRGLVMGIQGCGTGIGGFVLAPVAQVLLDRVGIAWTNRFFAGYCFVVCGISSFLIVERKKKTKETKSQQGQSSNITDVTEATAAGEGYTKKLDQPKDLHDISIKEIMKQPAFHMLLASQMVVSMVYLLPMYFMQTYSVHIGLTPQQGATVIAFFNGSTCIGRLGVGYLGDRFSKDKALLASVYLLGISVFAIWTFAYVYGTLVAFAVIYGIAFAGMMTLTPTKIADIYGPHRTASVLGVAWSVACPAMFLGTYAGSKILELSFPDTTYVPMIMFTGTGFVVSAALYSLWLLFARRQKRRIQAAFSASSASAP